jgi:hypothetical protein
VVMSCILGSIPHNSEPYSVNDHDADSVLGWATVAAGVTLDPSTS